MYLQTRKVFRGQLDNLSERFPGLIHLDLSNYAWLTDSEMMGLQVRHPNFTPALTVLFTNRTIHYVVSAMLLMAM